MLYNIFILIVDTVASVLAGVLLLRFWMQAVRVRPPAQVAQFTFQLSDWLVRPLRKVVPGVAGYDWASFVGACLVAILAVTIRAAFAPKFSIETVLLLALLDLVEWICYGLMGLIFIEVIFSWVNPHAPLAPFVHALNDPLMRPLRRIIPLVGSIDLTPLVALVLLQIVLRVMTELIARVF